MSAQLMDIEGALTDFLLANMKILTGSGTASVDIFSEEIPDTRGAMGICLNVSRRELDIDIPELETALVEFIVYSKKRNTTWLLCSNLDALLSGFLNLQLTPEVFCMNCSRNSGPGMWPGAFDDNSYSLVVYDFKLRNTA